MKEKLSEYFKANHYASALHIFDDNQYCINLWPGKHHKHSPEWSAEL